MTSAAPVTTDRCPRCGKPLEVTAGFVAWCGECEWNLDPTAADARPRRAVRAANRANRRGERLHAQLLTAGSLARRWTLARSAAFALAAAVHLSSIAVVVGGGGLLVLGWGKPLIMAAGVILVAFGLTLRPRFPRLDGDAVRIARADAPLLYGTIDAITARLGGSSPDVVVLSAQFNAGFAAVGFRRRPVLVIGLPLWWTLDGDERAAVVAHELAHGVNGDARRGLVVGSALDTLCEWESILTPVPLRETRLLDWLTHVVLLPGYFLVRSVATAVLLTSLRDHQRAEYLADALTRRVVSRLVAVSAVEASGLLDATSWRSMKRAALNQRDMPLATVLGSNRRSLPAHELERLRRLAIRRGHAPGSTHPPTHRRIQYLEALGTECETDDPITFSAAVDAELEPFATAVEADLRRDLRHITMA